MLGLPLFVHINSYLPPLPIGSFLVAALLPVSWLRGRISRQELVAIGFLLINITLVALKLLVGDFSGQEGVYITSILQMVLWPLTSGLSRLAMKQLPQFLAGMFWGAVSYAVIYLVSGGLRNFSPVPGIGYLVFYQVYDYVPSLLAFLIPIGAGLGAFKGFPWGMPYYLAVAVSLVGLLHMQSRASILVAILGISFMALAILTRKRGTVVPALLGVAFFTLLLLSDAQIWSYPFDTIGGRAQIWLTNLGFWLQTPTTFLIGVQRLTSLTSANEVRLATAHNQFLDIAVKQGAAALGVFLVMGSQVLGDGLGLLRRAYNRGLMLQVALAVSVLLQFILNSQVVLVLEQPVIAVPIWLGAGLLGASLNALEDTQ